MQCGGEEKRQGREEWLEKKICKQRQIVGLGKEG